MRQPTNNPVSLEYGATSPPPYTATNTHAGTDYSYYSDKAKTVPAPDWVAPEQVKISYVRLTDDGACGKTVEMLSLDNQRRYRACHNAEIYVNVGQTINEGTRIAKMGSTGAAQGAHLHLVMWVDGIRVNPKITIDALKGGDIVLNDNGIKNMFLGFLRRPASEADLNYWRGKPYDKLQAELMNTSAFGEVNDLVAKGRLYDAGQTGQYVKLPEPVYVLKK